MRTDDGGSGTPAATSGRGRRVLVCTHYWQPHVGGIEAVARAQAHGLAGRGWRLTVHTSRIPADGAATTDEGAVRVHRHATWNPFESRLRLPVPLIAPTMGAGLVAEARRADVIVAHGHVYPSSVYAAWAARRSGTPLVVIQHSPWVDYPPPLATVERGADRTLGRLVLGAATRIVCVSRHTAAYVRTIAPRARIDVVANGVDTTRFHPGPGLVLGSVVGAEDGAIHRPRFVCVRRLVPRMGIDLLLDAWRASGLDDRAELVIGGRGPDRPRLEARAAGLSGVRFAGFVPDAALADLYRSATAAVVPSRSGEGFGLTAAEALACGTPVVATEQGALPEVVTHEVDGLVVAPQVPALAAALRRIADDPALRARLASGARGPDRSWSRSVAALDVVLDAVAARSGGA